MNDIFDREARDILYGFELPQQIFDELNAAHAATTQAAWQEGAAEAKRDAYYDCASKAGDGKTVRAYAKSRLLQLPPVELTHEQAIEVFERNGMPNMAQLGRDLEKLSVTPEKCPFCNLTTAEVNRLKLICSDPFHEGLAGEVSHE